MGIVLNGKPIEEIQQERVALIREASQAISERRDQIIELVEKAQEMVATGSPVEDDLKPIAKQIQDILDELGLIYEATGVEYYFEGCDEYDGLSDGPLGQIENLASELESEFDISVFEAVAGTAQEMRWNIQVWNASTC